MAKNDLTAERLREVLHYNKHTGIFTWKITRKKAPTGKIAGTQRAGKYLIVKIDYCQYYAHRLAYLYITGCWPEFQVDHRNRIYSDNRWSNLRPATQKQNCENMKIRKDSKSGVAGVHWNSTTNKWTVRICHNKRHLSMGQFVRKADAVAARRLAERTYFTHA